MSANNRTGQFVGMPHFEGTSPEGDNLMLANNRSGFFEVSQRQEEMF
jgi:hypothetical protein